MGLFDYVKVEYPVPDPNHQDDEFQTYSLDCVMSHFTITVDGRLIHHRKRYERVPKEGRSDVGTLEQDDPFSRLADSLKVVEEWDEEIPLHRDVFLNGDRVEYVGRFTGGVSRGSNGRRTLPRLRLTVPGDSDSSEVLADAIQRQDLCLDTTGRRATSGCNLTACV